MGTVQRLWVKQTRRGPMDPVDEVRAVVGHGLDGNADAGGRTRQVTLLDADRWARAVAELGLDDLDPALRRANVLLTGVDLADRRGARLAVGDAVLRIEGETRPCRLMDEAHPGLQAALDADWGGGAFARVDRAGMIRRGDDVHIVD